MQANANKVKKKKKHLPTSRCTNRSFSARYMARLMRAIPEKGDEPAKVASRHGLDD